MPDGRIERTRQAYCEHRYLQAGLMSSNQPDAKIVVISRCLQCGKEFK